MKQDRPKGAVDAGKLQAVLATLEGALAGLDALELKVVAARLSLVIEEVRSLSEA